ncbi:MAG: sigma-70 family RNA polymerase sigma factor [Archangiaceae bacterium]|nr:sigma-70 family RNA polymerase sigma factor [Archangiaceae bacterium]
MSLDLRAVYEAEAEAVHAFLSRFGLANAEVEDAVHDTFLTALSRQKTYDPARPVRPWLLGIAFRIAVARVRTARPTTAELPEQSDLRQDPHAALETQRARELVSRALAELSEEQGTVFALYDLHGVSAADIAASMGAPLATTYSRLRLARQAFAAAVKRLHPESP